MLPIILLITFIGLMLASISDLKTREVPDWLNYSLVAIGLGIRSLYSILVWDYSFILSGLLGFGAFFFVAIAMFYAGQWGGGDSKLLMGMGALIGLEFSLQSELLAFIIYLFMAGAIYGLLWSVVLAIKHRAKYSKYVNELNKSGRTVKMAVWCITFLLLIPVVFIEDFSTKFMFFATSILIFSTYYLWIFIKAVEGACMIKFVSPAKLTEGDWIAKDVIVKGKYICGPKDLGIDRRQINQLKKIKIQKILIKEGIPFVPSFLFGFILTLTSGNWWLGFIL